MSAKSLQFLTVDFFYNFKPKELIISFSLFFLLENQHLDSGLQWNSSLKRNCLQTFQSSTIVELLSRGTFPKKALCNLQDSGDDSREDGKSCCSIFVPSVLMEKNPLCKQEKNKSFTLHYYIGHNHFQAWQRINNSLTETGLVSASVSMHQFPDNSLLRHYRE